MRILWFFTSLHLLTTMLKRSASFSIDSLLKTIDNEDKPSQTKTIPQHHLNHLNHLNHHHHQQQQSHSQNEQNTSADALAALSLSMLQDWLAKNLNSQSVLQQILQTSPGLQHSAQISHGPINIGHQEAACKSFYPFLSKPNLIITCDFKIVARI